MAALPRNDPAAAGFDAAKLAEACAWAGRHDSGVPESLDAYLAASAFKDGAWG